MHSSVKRLVAQAVVALNLVLILQPSLSPGQDPVDAQNQALRTDRWLVVLCGLPGDQLHRERLNGAVQQIVAAAEPVLLIPKQHVRVLVGDDEMVEEVKGTVTGAAVCTGESVHALFQELGQQISAADACWVICLGHAQLSGARSTFNVQGPDFDAGEFARALAPVRSHQRVLMLTMPVTGFWIKPLKATGTIAIAATEVGPEQTATEMPYALADVLAGTQAHQALADIDEDGQLSLLDLYLAVNLEIHHRYKARERLQTEHAQLDDNGDGLGKELQEAYLPKEEEEGTVPLTRPLPNVAKTLNSDGDLARRTSIGKPSPVAEAR